MFIDFFKQNTFIVSLFFYSILGVPIYQLFSTPNGIKKETQIKKEEKPYLSLLFSGDTHFNWGVAELQKKEGLLAPVQQIKHIFEKADFRSINLECALTNKGYPLSKKSYIFHSSPKNISLLKYLDINLSVLGNNHSMDMGSIGLQDTIEQLENAKIATVGAGLNRAQAVQTHYFQKESIYQKKKNTHHFAIISLTRVGQKNIYSGKKKPGVVRRLTDKEWGSIKKETHKIINIHWGREYFVQPNLEQRKIAHAFIDKGASAIIGHHSHIPQAIEIYKGGVIFYSLGNFLFGSMNDLQKNNIIAILEFSKKSNQLERVRIIPINGQYMNNGHKIRPLSMKEATEFWNEYYLILERHSPYTASRLSVKKGIGILRM